MYIRKDIFEEDRAMTEFLISRSLPNLRQGFDKKRSEKGQSPIETTETKISFSSSPPRGKDANVRKNGLLRQLIGQFG